MRKLLVAAAVLALGIAPARAESPQLKALIQSLPGGSGWYQVNPETGQCDPMNTNPRGVFRWGVAHGYDMGAKDLPNVPMGVAEVITFGEPGSRSILLVRPYGACQMMRDLQQRDGVIPGH